jgi:hypothetical protein
MIIINQPHDKTSRDFVLEHGEGHTILDCPDCLTLYQAIPGGPCVVVPIPAYRDPTSGQDVAAFEYVYPFPATMAEVDAFVTSVEQRAIDHPYGGGA